MSRLLVPAVILLLPSLAGSLRAQAPNVVTRESTATATVDRIDRSSRVVTFRGGEGNTLQSVYVDPSVAAFDELKTGDVVTVRYVESVIVQVRPGAKPTEVQDTTEEARKAGEEGVIQQLRAVVTIDEIDPQGQFVTYRTNDNRKVMRPVMDKRVLEGIRAGDRVEITFTRARAIRIERGRR
jgi:Cu/Ag efflux protein CusF